MVLRMKWSVSERQQRRILCWLSRPTFSTLLGSIALICMSADVLSILASPPMNQLEKARTYESVKV